MTMIDTPATHTHPADSEPILPSIGKVDGGKVQRLRQNAGLSYDALIKAVGISHDDILGIENNVWQPPNQVLVTIAHVLGVHVRDILEDPPVALAEVAEATGEYPEDTPGLLHRDPEPINRELIDGIEAEETPVEIPEQTGGWRKTADVEQRQRLYAAEKAADILREFTGDGVFSRGGSKTVNAVDVITLAQWIVYGTHDQ